MARSVLLLFVLILSLAACEEKLGLTGSERMEADRKAREEFQNDYPGIPSWYLAKVTVTVGERYDETVMVDGVAKRKAVAVTTVGMPKMMEWIIIGIIVLGAVVGVKVFGAIGVISGPLAINVLIGFCGLLWACVQWLIDRTFLAVPVDFFYLCGVISLPIVLALAGITAGLIVAVGSGTAWARTRMAAARHRRAAVRERKRDAWRQAQDRKAIEEGAAIRTADSISLFTDQLGATDDQAILVRVAELTLPLRDWRPGGDNRTHVHDALRRARKRIADAGYSASEAHARLDTLLRHL